MIKHFITQKFNQWLERRVPAQSSIKLDSGNIFVFPNRMGWMFLSLTIVIYIIGTNYQNNLILLVAYALLGLGLVSVFHGFAQLYRITIKQQGCEMSAVFELTHARLKITAKHPINSLTCRFENQPSHTVQLRNAEKIEQIGEQWLYHIHIPFTAKKRGIHQLPRLTLETTYPFGIIRCWSKVDLAIEHIAYPQPIMTEQHTAHSSSDDLKAKGKPSKEATTEDFDGISNYRQGDPINRIAWKQSAKSEHLLNKQFKRPTGTRHLSLQLFPQDDKELALSKLCYLVQQLSSQKHPFSLALSTQGIAANEGEYHRQQCLMALAKEI